MMFGLDFRSRLRRRVARLESAASRGSERAAEKLARLRERGELIVRLARDASERVRVQRMLADDLAFRRGGRVAGR